MHEPLPADQEPERQSGVLDRLHGRFRDLQGQQVNREKEMREIALADVVAERELERPGEGAPPAVVRIGRPYRVDEGEWACSFQVQGAGDERVLTAYGYDGVQALRLCFEMIRAELGARQREHGLTWLGEPDLGF